MAFNRDAADWWHGHRAESHGTCPLPNGRGRPAPALRSSPAEEDSMLGFMAGVVTGGVIGYHWRDQIHRYFDRKLPPVRDQVADGLHQVEQSTSDVLGRLRNGISA